MASTKTQRNLKEDAIKYSGLLWDKRFTTYVRFVDWVDFQGAPAEAFRGSYVEDGLVEVKVGRPRVLMVRATYGKKSQRRAGVKFW